jgi:ParB-like chromosome segregation protein Spo0J
VAKIKLEHGSNRASAVGEWELMPLARLTPAVRRTRTHSGKKRQIVEASIREYGILDPITINSANVIIDGHLRVEVARKLGFREVPVIRISHLSDAELRAYAIAANKLPGVANYDLDALRIELEEIRADVPTMDLTLTGALSDQRGTDVRVLLAGKNEPQISGEAAKPLPPLQLLAGGNPAGSHDVRPLPAVAAQRRRPTVRARHRHLP